MSKGVNALDEHTLIQTYFSDVGSAYLAEQDVRISVGDDSSIISLPSGKESVVSVDTSIENVHFLDSMSPDDIAYRAVCEVVGIKDIVAKSLGSPNSHNVVRACMKGLSNQLSPKNIFYLRGKKKI